MSKQGGRRSGDGNKNGEEQTHFLSHLPDLPDEPLPELPAAIYHVACHCQLMNPPGRCCAIWPRRLPIARAKSCATHPRDLATFSGAVRRHRRPLQIVAHMADLMMWAQMAGARREGLEGWRAGDVWDVEVERFFARPRVAGMPNSPAQRWGGRRRRRTVAARPAGRRADARGAAGDVAQHGRHVGETRELRARREWSPDEWGSSRPRPRANSTATPAPGVNDEIFRVPSSAMSREDMSLPTTSELEILRVIWDADRRTAAGPDRQPEGMACLKDGEHVCGTSRRLY